MMDAAKVKEVTLRVLGHYRPKKITEEVKAAWTECEAAEQEEWKELPPCNLSTAKLIEKDSRNPKCPAREGHFYCRFLRRPHRSGFLCAYPFDEPAGYTEPEEDEQAEPIEAYSSLSCRKCGSGDGLWKPEIRKYGVAKDKEIYLNHVCAKCGVNNGTTSIHFNKREDSEPDTERDRHWQERAMDLEGQLDNSPHKEILRRLGDLENHRGLQDKKISTVAIALDMTRDHAKETDTAFSDTLKGYLERLDKQDIKIDGVIEDLESKVEDLYKHVADTRRNIEGRFTGEGE